MTSETTNEGAGTRPGDAQRMLAIVRALCVELGHTALSEPSLDTPLQAGLGIDSLGRIELLLRVQRAFDVVLPDDVALEAETARALYVAVERARGSPRPAGEAPLELPSRSPHERIAKLEIPAAAGDLGEVLRFHARQASGRVHLTLLDDGGAREMSYGELDRRARDAARSLEARGVAPGDRVGLMLPTSADYFISFFAVLLAGAIPVPIYPPARWGAIAEHLRRQGAILNDARVTALITSRAGEAVAVLLKSDVSSLARVVIAEDLADPGDGASTHALPRVTPESAALIQYTSGSTGRPKGVLLTHANLLANVRAIGIAQAVTHSDVTVSWLPLYHDMGLIGAWLVSLYHGCRFVVMPPQAFLVRPERWLRAIHEYRGTLSPAPNFAYELCASRLDDSVLEGLNLGSWRVALNGAEPVSPRTLERFVERFAPRGFDPGALAPVYGLAECSVALTMPRRGGAGARIDRIDRRALHEDQVAAPVAEESPHALRVVGCGYPIPGHEVRIVGDGDSRAPLPERRQGRVQFRGPSATSGYFENAEATARLRSGDDGWLETGDLGYLADGELFVTGRAKDLVIRAGRKIHPQDIEEAVGDVPGIRKGCVAVFGVSDEARGTERLIVVAETRVVDPLELGALAGRVRAACEPLLEGHPDDVVLAPPRSIPKTSSGKIRRGACRELYESGRLGRTTRSLSGLARIVSAATGMALRSASRRIAELAYALYGLAAVHLFKVVLFFSILMLPGVKRRRRALGALARGFLRAVFVDVTVSGREHLTGRPCIAAANHQSFLDTILMSALVPETFFFTPKGDLREDLLARTLMTRLGYEFVDRLDPKAGVSDLDRVRERLSNGESAVVYPEGIFYPQPGLQRFYMGAFSLAAQAKTPVVPVAIRGARSIWRGETMRPFFRRGSVAIIVLPAVEPEGSGWDAAVKLRNDVRGRILAHCGEFDALG